MNAIEDEQERDEKFSTNEDCYFVSFHDAKLGIKIRKKSNDGFGAIVSEGALDRDIPTVGDAIVVLAGIRVEFEPFASIVRMIK